MLVLKSGSIEPTLGKYMGALFLIPEELPRSSNLKNGLFLVHWMEMFAFILLFLLINLPAVLMYLRSRICYRKTTTFTWVWNRLQFVNMRCRSYRMTSFFNSEELYQADTSQWFDIHSWVATSMEFLVTFMAYHRYK